MDLSPRARRVGVETIRFYEREGLIAEPGRRVLSQIWCFEDRGGDTSHPPLRRPLIVVMQSTEDGSSNDPANRGRLLSGCADGAGDLLFYPARSD